jgi:hypothetical protein
MAVGAETGGLFDPECGMLHSDVNRFVTGSRTTVGACGSG